MEKIKIGKKVKKGKEGEVSPYAPAKVCRYPLNGGIIPRNAPLKKIRILNIFSDYPDHNKHLDHVYAYSVY